ncbi:MAG: four-helix bundle copper-binding protein [Bacillota bacterium]
MLESSKGEMDNLGRISSGELSCRDMRSFDDRPYTQETDDEAQIEEDSDEGWDNQKQSSSSGHNSGTIEALERIQNSELEASEGVRECLEDSLECYKTCSETALRCLNMGGKHAKSTHLNLLIDCAKICNTNADFILRNSNYYPQTCGITADICDECADSCDRFDDDFMKECAQVCRRCAESCREVAR